PDHGLQPEHEPGSGGGLRTGGSGGCAHVVAGSQAGLPGGSGGRKGAQVPAPPGGAEATHASGTGGALGPGAARATKPRTTPSTHRAHVSVSGSGAGAADA